MYLVLNKKTFSFPPKRGATGAEERKERASKEKQKRINKQTNFRWLYFHSDPSLVFCSAVIVAIAKCILLSTSSPKHLSNFKLVGRGRVRGAVT